MMERLRNNETLRELMIGIAVWCILAEGILLLLCKGKLYQSIGLAAGFVTALILAYSMAASVEEAVLLDEKGAAGFIRRKAVFRYLLACTVIVVLAITDIGNPLTCFAGMMGLKIGAYLQPLTHRVIRRSGMSDE